MSRSMTACLLLVPSILGDSSTIRGPGFRERLDDDDGGVGRTFVRSFGCRLAVVQFGVARGVSTDVGCDEGGGGGGEAEDRVRSLGDAVTCFGGALVASSSNSSSCLAFTASNLASIQSIILPIPISELEGAHAFDVAATEEPADDERETPV